MKRYLVRHALFSACAIGTMFFGVSFATAMSPLDLSTQTTQSVANSQTNLNLIKVRDSGRGGDRIHNGHSSHHGVKHQQRRSALYGANRNNACAYHSRSYRAHDNSYLNNRGERVYCH